MLLGDGRQLTDAVSGRAEPSRHMAIFEKRLVRWFGVGHTTQTHHCLWILMNHSIRQQFGMPACERTRLSYFETCSNSLANACFALPG